MDWGKFVTVFQRQVLFRKVLYQDGVESAQRNINEDRVSSIWCGLCPTVLLAGEYNPFCGKYKESVYRLGVHLSSIVPTDSQLQPIGA